MDTNGGLIDFVKFKMWSVADNVHESVEKNMNEQPFIYRKCLYCSLDCFFDAYVKQPGLCMWIDSLFCAAVKIKQAQMHAMDGGGSKSSSSFNHK